MAITASRGFDLHYETHGGGDGVPLVLIMGMGGTCQGWMVLTVPALQDARRCVIFDNRGAGRSGDPGVSFTTADMAGDTLALLDALEIPRAHILGGFLGGCAAQELAISHPDRVQSLILVGTCARVDARRRMLLELWKSMVEADMPQEDLLKHRLIWTLHDLAFEQQDLIDAMWRFYLTVDAPMEKKVFVRQVDAMLAHDAVDRLEQISAPTLLICGDQDLLTPPHLHREMRNRVTQSRLVQMSGAGHLVAAELAPRFNALVSRFMLEFDGER
jgi:pimeloyl-ACP methyl ester carboxylesterase